MPSAATESALVPSFNFTEAVALMEKDESLNLPDVLAKLATIPVVAPAAPKKKADKATVARELEEEKKALATLPDAFGIVEEPSSRRLLTKTELAQVLAEKAAISEAKSALVKRETKLNEMTSTHFDCYAEKLKLVDPEKTPRDAKGHYLIGAKGNRLEQAIEGSEQILTREKSADKATLSHELLLAAYEAGEVTRSEYLSLTTTVRVLDEKKIRAWLLSKQKRERTQQIVKLITQVTPGKLSVHVR